MQTLSYGFQLPETGDKGATVWTALESDITQVNSHTHDGQNSAPISAANLASTQANILAASWASYTGAPTGHYRQLVTMAAGFTFDQKNMSFRTSDGQLIWPTVNKHDNTSFYIYTTDNSVSMVVNYGG